MKRLVLTIGMLLLLALAVAGAVTGAVAAGAGGAPSARVALAAPAVDTPTATPTCPPNWSTVTSPTLELEDTELYKVDALSTSDLWAVGLWYTGTQGHGLEHDAVLSPHRDHSRHGDQVNRLTAQTLIDHWNGSEWTVITTTNTGFDDNLLLSVDAVSANDVWAAGYYINDLGVAQTLILHWDGTNWSRVPSANSSPLTDNQLFSVQAVSATDVWAVGTYANDTGIFQTLTEHWNGTAWSIASSPNSGINDNLLRDLAAVSSGDVWAVGYYVNETERGYRALTERWNGTAWSIVANPGVGSGSNSFSGVDAVAANDVWAVGSFSSIRGDARVLIEHWDGTTWNVVAGGHLEADYAHFDAIDAVSTNDIWAVGSYVDYESGYYYEALTEHWDGTTWSVVPSAHLAESSQTDLYDVAGIAPNDAWAVGSYVESGFNGYENEALVERYSTDCIPLNCTITFTDVQPADYYYYPLLYLYCRGAVSGYADNTFRPGNNTTRAQLSKIVVLAEGWDIVRPLEQHFTDVFPWDTFAEYIETAYSHGIVAGYTCPAGTPTPPFPTATGTATPPIPPPTGTVVPGPACLEFRPGNNITRAQLSKVIVLAQGWTAYTPPTPTFNDVPATDPFYQYIETAYHHGVISGYSDGTFRPGNNATRGQIAKIVFNALTQP